jgi:nitrite reductase/ring-hydroxylating ferredoxin subunit
MKVALSTVDAVPATGTITVDWFGREVLLYRVDEQIKALVNICVHLGGPLEQAGEQFVCPWHNAAFSCRDGRRVRGPARADAQLMFLPTRIEDGTLYYVWGE